MSRKVVINENMLSRGLFPQKDPYNAANSTKRTNYDLFTPDYFTAEDINLYIGDIWVDEVTAIEYTLTEDVFPIHGYHSYTYDAIARGKRMVSGSLLINFKEAEYLKNVMAHSEAIGYHIEQGLQSNIIRPMDISKYKLSQILSLLGKDSFDQIAEEFQREMWEDPDYVLYRNRSDQAFFMDTQSGVEIKVTYGPQSEYRNQKLTEDFYNQNLAITPNRTSEFINGVQFYQVGKVMSTDMSPSPIAEEYRFVARDISGESLRDQSILEAIELAEKSKGISEGATSSSGGKGNSGIGGSGAKEKPKRPKVPGYNDVGPTTY